MVRKWWIFGWAEGGNSLEGRLRLRKNGKVTSSLTLDVIVLDGGRRIRGLLHLGPVSFLGDHAFTGEVAGGQHGRQNGALFLRKREKKNFLRKFSLDCFLGILWIIFTRIFRGKLYKNVENLQETQKIPRQLS